MKIYGWRVPESCHGAGMSVSEYGDPPSCPAGAAAWWYWFTAAALAAFWLTSGNRRGESQ
jgi:hypothetical protein